MDEPKQIVRVAVDPQFLQLQSAALINSDFAEECRSFFESGGTLDGMYAQVLRCKARKLVAHQQAITI